MAKGKVYAPQAISNQGIALHSKALYTLSYFTDPVITGQNIYGSRKLAKELVKSVDDLPRTARISTLSNEMQIYRHLMEHRGKLRRNEAYADVLERSAISPILLTDTILRVPEGHEGKSEYVKGRKTFRRIVLEHGESVGEVFVPEGSGRIVPGYVPVEDAIDMVYGTPIMAASDNRRKHDLHFVFDDNPEPDRISHKRDVVITIAFEPTHKRNPRCLAIQGIHRPSDTVENFGIRFVYGRESKVA